MDHVAEQVDPFRSYILSFVKSKNTTPEITLRKALFARGYRYYIHDKSLPGTPDIVFPRKRIVIFVNGCFWHRHDCGRANMPKVRVSYWERKFENTLRRDARNHEQLKSLGWTVLIVWECEILEDLESSLQVIIRQIERQRKKQE